MAYPIISSYSTGVVNSSQLNHSITLPSIINTNDLLIIALTSHRYNLIYDINTGSSSSNWHKYFILSNADIVHDEGWGWFWIFDDGLVYYDLTVTILIAKALGNGNDILNVTSQYVLPSKLHRKEYSVIYANPSYICYSISGVKYYSDNFPCIRYRCTAANTTNWNLNPLFISGEDDNDIGEYLWLSFYGGLMNSVVTAPPSGWSNLHTAQGLAIVLNSTSLSSCEITSNGVSSIDPGPCTAPVSQWIGMLIKIYSASSSIPSTITISNTLGVGTYIYNKEAYKNENFPSIIVSPVDQKYNYDQTPDLNYNPYGYYVEVISNASWTAAWNTGTYFYANAYSGSEGVTYLGINCVNNNTSGISYTDTLIFTISGSADSVYVEQYTQII